MGFFSKGPEKMGNSNPQENEEAPKKKLGFLASINEAGKRSLIESATKPRLLVCPQGVITYKMRESKDGTTGTSQTLNYVFSPESIDRKIEQILVANPNALMSESVQESLGITVVSFEKSK